jgi:DNA-binding MarR family transcriptional regulator
VTNSQAELLDFIRVRPRTVVEIAAHLGVNTSSASVRAQRLVDRKLVKIVRVGSAYVFGAVE